MFGSGIVMVTSYPLCGVLPPQLMLEVGTPFVMTGSPG
jgi:hypothetical protein